MGIPNSLCYSPHSHVGFSVGDSEVGHPLPPVRPAGWLGDSLRFLKKIGIGNTNDPLDM